MRRRGTAIGVLVAVALLAPGSASHASPPGQAGAAAAVPSTEEIFSWVRDIAAIGYRRTGTPSGRRAAEYVRGQFEALGLEDVHYETAPSWLWDAEQAGLAVEGQAVDAFPAAHSFVTPGEPSRFSTGPGGRTAELVDVGLATPVDFARTDVRGKIVVFDLKFLVPLVAFGALTEFFWDPLLSVTRPPQALLTANPYITSISLALEEAMERGAVGFVGVLTDYFDSNRYFNELYRELDITIPGMWVTRAEGARMRRLMRRAGGAPEGTMVLEGSRSEVEARTVVGFLHGRSRDTIQVQSHHDSVWEGAVEDASGTAEVLALAKAFAAVPAAQREKTLMFSTFDSHFSGYQQHQAFVRKYVTERRTPYRLVANVTLEHIGRHGLLQDGRLVVTDLPEPRGVFENVSAPLKLALARAIVRHDLRRTFVLNGALMRPIGGIPTDADFVFEAGVPTISLVSGPLYLYDAADTLDKVAKEELRPVAQAFAEVVEAIDATPSDEIPGPLG